MSNQTKICSKCNQEKSLSDFYRDFRNESDAERRASYCKLCKHEGVKAWRARNQNKVKSYNEAFRDKYKERSKGYRLKYLYGISEDEFNRLLKEQNGCCAICKEELDKPCVDHCHTTSKVRGLLCHDCNKGLGQFKDSPEILNSAINYILNNKEN